MTQDWRLFRPAIWIGMVGIALILLISPPYLGAIVLGGAIGMGLKIETSRRRIARGLPPRRGRLRR